MRTRFRMRANELARCIRRNRRENGKKKKKIRQGSDMSLSVPRIHIYIFWPVFYAIFLATWGENSDCSVVTRYYGLHSILARFAAKRKQEWLLLLHAVSYLATICRSSQWYHDRDFFSWNIFNTYLYMYIHEIPLVACFSREAIYFYL